MSTEPSGSAEPSGSTEPSGSAETSAGEFDVDAPWRRSPSVAVRPEPFGALLYDFATRRLSFLTSPVLVTLVEGLAEAPTAAAALDRVAASGQLTATGRPRYLRALARLAADGTIVPRATEVRTP